MTSNIYPSQTFASIPGSAIIGRVLENGMDVRSQPIYDSSDPNLNNTIAEVNADDLVECGRQIVEEGWRVNTSTLC